MLERLDVNKNHVTYYIKKIITITIRSTYYIYDSTVFLNKFSIQYNTIFNTIHLPSVIANNQ